MHGGARVQQPAVGVGTAAAVRNVAADGVDTVAVQRTLADVLAHRMQSGALFLAEQVVEQAMTQALRQARLHVHAQFVM